MANVEREDNMLNEEQESSQSNSSNGSSSVVQPSSFQLKSSVLRQSTFGGSSFLGGGGGGGGSSSSNSISSSPSLAGSVGGTGGSLSNSFNLKPSVLKPSQLTFGGIGSIKEGNGAADKNGNDAVGIASTNPFLKMQFSEEEPSESDAKGSSAESSKSGTENRDGAGDSNANSSNNIDPLAKLKSASLPKSNLFANVKKSTLSEASCGFVFGQNVHERVTGENLNNATSGNNLPTTGFSFATSVAATSGESGAAGGGTVNAASSGPNATGTTPGNKEGSDSSDGSSREPKDRESLEEAARRYEESRGALKRKYEEVETITGEEDERNVVEINCKLFAFAKSNWEERGHGTLRLNDKDNNESRVVFRQSGNLRVLINTKVWSGMVAQQPSQKSLRLTAIDSSGQIKVFLVMSRPDVITKLHKELSKRIETAKQTAELEAAKENKDDNKPPVIPIDPASIDGADVEDDGSTIPVPVDTESLATSVDAEEPCPKKRSSITSSPPSS
ncbi:ran-binding protein 3 [Anopheles maculipalpis]|uniref:ran-binding protein 3 n=1 Tax=Anopheles maculipalpis TaxID=1496333 RepID=UPI0021598676|nr:ran-binding protein 3 [Anopheles maculipalpis]